LSPDSNKTSFTCTYLMGLMDLMHEIHKKYAIVHTHVNAFGHSFQWHLLSFWDDDIGNVLFPHPYQHHPTSRGRIRVEFHQLKVPSRTSIKELGSEATTTMGGPIIRITSTNNHNYWRRRLL
jgi:hypothetical protein